MDGKVIHGVWFAFERGKCFVVCVSVYTIVWECECLCIQRYEICPTTLFTFVFNNNLNFNRFPFYINCF